MVNIEQKKHLDETFLIGGAMFPCRVGIVDADLIDHGTRFPNLALMKISGYYKAAGSNVHLIESYEEIDYEAEDVIFCSKVFTFSACPDSFLEQDNVVIGGTGFYEDGGPDLPCVIEHHMPDYDLYDSWIKRRISEGIKPSYFADYLDFSIGFATRGCFRKCSFCVNKKYNRVQFHSNIREWLAPDRKCIYLWDDNIMAYAKWREVFKELEEIGKPFQFRQGLDIRLMTDEKAEVISKSRYYGDFIFAFDYIEDKELIEKKLNLWRRHCVKETKLYVLCAYSSQDASDIRDTFERIKILFKYGCLPYIMRHERYKESRYRGMYIQIARWCNQPNIVKKMSFRQFCEANQLRKKTPGDCSSLKAMKEFEKYFPDIAKEYFDIRFEEQAYVKHLKSIRAKH